MHIWPSKAVIKTNRKNTPAYNLSKIPKGTSTAEWQKRVAEFKYERLVEIDKVPKPVRATKTKRAEEN
jgi:hypothetical protein